MRTVNKEQRILIVVNSLSQHGDKRLARLYRFSEKAGVKLAVQFLGSHYRKIEILKDDKATLDNFMLQLTMAAQSIPDGALDLFLQLHGESGKLRFFDRWIESAELALYIKGISRSDVFRLVYNTSCYGNSHSSDLIRGGFKSAVGSLGINSNGATEYPLFCRCWPGTGVTDKKTCTLDDVIRRADRPTPRKIQDYIASRYFPNADSRKLIKGCRTLTIGIMPIDPSVI